MDSTLAISETDNLVEGEVGANLGKLGPVAADVDGESLLRKDLTAAVRAENAYRDFDLFAGLATPAHHFEQPRYVQDRRRFKDYRLHTE